MQSNSDSENIISDSEILNISDFNKINNNGNLFHVCTKFYYHAKLKLASLLFIVFIILNTDIYAEAVLSKFFKNSYDSDLDTITEKGIIISGIIMVVLYIFLDILYEKKML